ncbi:polysaccharide deacetylase family protein [Streptomyces sp. NPDC049916]|uniref:polysaccharide deacetylase family protein n=1 Tax=Streptomyces sp. NPDC049916 TaxID=3155156 RepID=UPI0034317875
MEGHRASVRRREALGAGAGLLAATALTAGCGRASGGRAGSDGVPGATGAASRALSSPGPRSPAGPAAPRRFPGQPAQIVHGPRDRPRIALTFDGHGDPDVARAALDRIEQAGARVTVLAVGSWLARYPGMARRVLDGGHELGNHTEHHLDLAALDEDAAYEEIAACTRRLRRLTGSIGTWFRPSPTPYASARVQRLARRAGYPHVLACDVESLDHEATHVAAVTRKVAGELRNGSVVGMSLGRPVTAAALPLLLAEIGRRGLHAVTATELLSRPASRPHP